MFPSIRSVFLGIITSLRRTTSSHLHVVSAGNSQRNSFSVSECQEELNNAIIPLSTTRPTSRKPSLRTSRNTKHYSPSTVEGVAPLSHTPHDGEWSLSHSICPARQRFTVLRLTRTRSSQDGDGWTIHCSTNGRHNDDNITTTTTTTNTTNTTNSSELQFET